MLLTSRSFAADSPRVSLHADRDEPLQSKEQRKPNKPAHQVSVSPQMDAMNDTMVMKMASRLAEVMPYFNSSTYARKSSHNGARLRAVPSLVQADVKTGCDPDNELQPIALGQAVGPIPAETCKDCCGGGDGTFNVENCYKFNAR